jgi:hypothetical protein
MPMGSNTQIYNRWQGYSLADCACEFCIHYAGKDQPCPLDVCCCADERREAFLREYGGFGYTLPDEGVTPCRE